jgi:tetratricopeptide (TPR) repeat protein
VDTGRPFLIVAAKDERTMKSPLPTYWEQKGGIRWAGVGESDSVRDFVVLRADASTADPDRYAFAYWNYAASVITSSYPGLPLRAARGLADLYAHTTLHADHARLDRGLPQTFVARKLSGAEVLGVRGALHVATRRFADAKAALEEAERLAPQLLEVHESLALLAMEQKDVGEARRRVEEALKRDEKSLVARRVEEWLDGSVRRGTGLHGRRQEPRLGCRGTASAASSCSTRPAAKATSRPARGAGD